MANCHVISLNVRGLRNKDKRSQIFRWFKYQKSDILFLQETYWSTDLETIIRSEWHGPCFFAHGTNHSRGVSILVNDKSNVQTPSIKCMLNGQLLMLKVKIHNMDILLVNVYAPTQKQHREGFFRKLMSEISKYYTDDCELILGGDWNCVLDMHKDVQGIENKYYKKPVNLKRLITKYDLCDIWRQMHSDINQYTWRNISLKRASRLDFWLVTKQVKRQIFSADIRPAIRTDHNAISIKLSLKQNERGPGYWKINTEILKDITYREKVLEIIHSLSESNFSSPQIKWEMFKIRIREFSQKFCKQKSLDRKNDKLTLDKKLCKLEKEINVNIPNKKLEEEYSDTKERLEKIYKHESRGAGIRARIRWMEEGEKSTKYFLSLEKNNAKKKEISHLKCKNNRTVSRNEEIINEIVNYYSHLYKKEKHEIKHMESYICSQNIKQLSSENKELCEGLLTVKECERAVFAMQKNKAPGSDGISIEFYQVFWSQIKTFLVDALNECYVTGLMSNTQRKGLITLLFKKGDSHDLKNWRPITLLNCDYKIMAAVLAARVHKVIGEIVHGDQTGYIKGRQASSNIRLTRDVIEYFIKNNKNAAIMLADFTKAFDVLDIRFLNLCLEKFNFGESFRKWISVLYTHISSSVLVNGWISKSFDIERGIRQGCPLSSLLFILAAEFMANRVRENNSIKPIIINECDFNLKLLQYADDTLFFVPDVTSLKEILYELNQFGNLAGTKINKDKTVMIWLGDMDRSWNIDIYNLKWSHTPVKYLGHYIHSNIDKAVKMDWDDKLAKLKKILDSWKKRNLTIFGRVTVLKSLALSQITHLIIVDSIPPNFLKTTESIVFKFIWNGKIEKIKRVTLTEDYNKGGIKMLDIQRQLFSFRLKWLSRFFNESNATWRTMFSYWFNLIGGINLLLNCSYGVNTLSNIVLEKKIPSFYKEILEAWEIIRHRSTVKDVCLTSNKSVNMLTQIVWHNRHVLYDNQSLFYKEWYDSGILYLGDLFMDGGFRSIEYIKSQLRSKRRKCNAVFDYARLRQAIPRVWVNRIKEENVQYTKQDNALEVPSLLVGNKVKHVTNMSSKGFYQLIPSKNVLTNTCCLYWEDKLNADIDWPLVFRRNLAQVKENKLREFNLKLLYNILPVKSNLFKWGISNDDVCPNCNIKEDINHAFIECKLNEPLFKHLEKILRDVYGVTLLSFNIQHLLKIDCENNCILLLTIGFWTIYKLIIDRNFTGIDKRNIAAKQIFQREILKRMEIQSYMDKKHMFLPKELLCVT